MNKIIAAASAALLTTTALHADDVPKDQKDKVSYSIGMNIGSKLKSQGIDVNSAMLAAGINDAISGAKPRLTDQDMEATMHQFATEMAAKAQAEVSKNKAAGEAYLDANKKKDGWKTTSSGLQYKVLTQGKGPIPKPSDTVVTNYAGTTIDGHEFDSSYKRNEPAEFPVKEVIPGWTEALQLMPVGSKYQLAVPANLAYGEQPPPGSGLAPNSVLLFDLELLGIKKPEDQSQNKTPDEKK